MKFGSLSSWLWIFVGCLGVTALMGMAALLLPSVPFEEEALSSAAILTVYSFLGLCAAVTIARGNLPRLSWTSVGLLAMSLCVWLVIVWFQVVIPWRTEEIITKAGGTLTAFGVLGLQVSLVMMARLTRTVPRLIRTGAIATASLGVVMLNGAFWEIWTGPDDWYWRVMGALFIPAALGTIAVPVLAWIESATRTEDHERTIGRAVPVSLRCPRCDCEQQVPANRQGRCNQCGLKITVKIDEPRCECGYLLYGLRDGVCPECGKEIDARDRWEAGTDQGED